MGVNRDPMLLKPTLHAFMLKPKGLPTQWATALLFAATARQLRLHVSSFMLPVNLAVADKPYKEPYNLLHGLASQQQLAQYIKIFASQTLNLTSSLQDLPISKNGSI